MIRLRNLWTLAGSLSLAALTAAPAFATNGYQLIAVGSYQKGMAGATTAAPYDAMAALTNPAGMALIGSRADFNIEMFNPNRRVDLASFGGGSTEGGSRLYGVPAIGWTAPAFKNPNIHFGGGMYGTSGLGVDYDVFNAGPSLGNADIYTAIQFWKMAPTISAHVTERLALGIALNADYQSVIISEAFTGGAFPSVKLDLSRSPGTFGIGTTVGALYKLTDRVDVGASYSSQQYFQSTEYRLPANSIQNFPQAGGLATNTNPGRFDFDLNFPQQWAIGLATRPIDRWLVSFDIKWINWAATHDSVKLNGDFTIDTDLDFTPDTPTSSIGVPFGWDNQWVFAVGTQYQLTDAFTVRAGFNHAKAPMNETDVFNNLAFPAVVENHLTLGATYRFGDHWEMSGAYKKAFKKELTGQNDIPAVFQTLGFPADSNAKIAMDQHSFGVQMSYRF
jgi:long-chain fatty acid transport protein